MNNELEHLIEQQEAIIAESLGVERSWKEFRRRWSIIFGCYFGGAILMAIVAFIGEQAWASVVMIGAALVAALLFTMNWCTCSTQIQECQIATRKFRRHLEAMKVTQREWRGY